MNEIPSSSGLKPPKNFNVNNPETWKEWLQQYKWFSVATGLDKKTSAIQAANFMTIIGTDAIRLFNTFNLTPEQQNDISVIITKFEEHFKPKANITYERFKFNGMMQSSGQSFDEYFTSVQTQAKKCDFGVLEDSLVRDRIVIGVTSEVAREKLLIIDELTLIKAAEVCRAVEQASKQMNALRQQNGENVNVNVIQENKFNCRRCGQIHGNRQCPAYKMTCKKCQKQGHFAKVCRSTNQQSHQKSRATKKGSDKKSNPTSKANIKVEALDEENNDNDLYLFYHESESREIKIQNDVEDYFVQKLVFEKGIVNFNLDTGAQCNVMPLKIANSLNAEIKPTKVKNLVSYSRHKIPVIGEASLPCYIKDNNVQKYQVNFKIIDDECFPILGKTTCRELHLIQRLNNDMQINNVELQIESKVFDGLGCIKNFEYDIDIVDGAKFKMIPARKIPYAIKEQVKAEIDNMMKMGVIEQVNNPTPVVSPMVIVKQKKKLRICLDPSEVNKNLLRRQHPLTSIEEIAARITGSKYFTVLDCKKGFWQIKVSEKTKKYLTFSTPWGRYCFTRLPFGLSSAPEVFQKVMNELLREFDKVEVSMDDILIHASTLEESNKKINSVIRKLSNSGIKLNKDKCIFNAKEVKFLGHLLTETGLKADQIKIEAIERLGIPSCKKQLQRFLGMINYLAKFIPNMSEITEPLRKLLINNVEWSWEFEQQQSFDKLKKLLTSTPVLSYYDVNKDVVLSVDASSKAFGAVLLQDNHPVAYATKAMSKAQMNYPQIEKEASAIRFACKKFHEYIYGKNLIIETDHKPLEVIFKKLLQEAPARLQRIMFDVLQYSPKIIYKKGTQIPIADALSRDCENSDNVDELDDVEVNLVLAASEEFLDKLRRETDLDEDLKLLKKYIQSGFPEEKDIKKELKHYSSVEHQLACYEGILFKSDKIIIPLSLQTHILKLIHQGHLGIQSSIKRARELVYWKSLSSDITNFIGNCSICQSNQKANTKEILIMKDVPDYPFQIVASDLFYFNSKPHVLIVDSYSGWYDFKKVKHETSSEVIKSLKQWFSYFGIPEKLDTDNGPQYTSCAFKKFIKDWNIQHRTSSPNFPQSNGLAERYVQTAKNMLKKCQKDESDVYLGLINFRNTPRDDNLKSPNQRLMSRVTRSQIPISKSSLCPNIVDDVQQNLSKLRQQQKFYADRHASIKPNLQVKDNIAIQVAPKNWVSGEVIEKLQEPRSYKIRTTSGKTFRRNSHHLRKCKARIPDEPKLSLGFPEEVIPPISSADAVGDMAGIDNADTVLTSVIAGNNQSSNDIPNPVVTRAGRIIKKPIKLNL